MLPVDVSLSELRGITGNQKPSAPTDTPSSSAKPEAQGDEKEAELRDTLIANAIRQFNISRDYQEKVMSPTTYQSTGR